MFHIVPLSISPLYISDFLQKLVSLAPWLRLQISIAHKDQESAIDEWGLKLLQSAPQFFFPSQIRHPKIGRSDVLLDVGISTEASTNSKRNRPSMMSWKSLPKLPIFVQRKQWHLEMETWKVIVWINKFLKVSQSFIKFSMQHLLSLGSRKGGRPSSISNISTPHDHLGAGPCGISGYLLKNGENFVKIVCF